MDEPCGIQFFFSDADAGGTDWCSPAVRGDTAKTRFKEHVPGGEGERRRKEAPYPFCRTRPRPRKGPLLILRYVHT